MFPRQILIAVAALFLTNAPAFSADSAPSPSKAEAEANICRELAADISRFAGQGDADMVKLLDTYQLTGDVDGTAMAKDQPKLERTLQGLCMGLLRLKEHDDHARSIVTKFKITQQPSPPNPPN